MFASDIMYTLALFLSRLSVCLFFRRLSGSTEKRLLPNILTCVCAALGVISVSVVALRQEVMEPWVQNLATVSCHHRQGGFYFEANIDMQLHRWIVIEAFGMIIDSAIVAYPVRLVWGLQMRAGMKFWVLVGFGIRLP